MYDGHRSHETIELREAAEKAKIHLFCIPPHTSHRLQPLDVGVFGPLQRAWQKRCLAVLEETGEIITRQNVVKEYMAARTQSVNEELVISAWRRSGIRPLNPDVLTEEDFAPSYSSSTSPPLPVSFPDSTNHLDPLSGGANEGNDGAENTGAESGTLIDASGLNVARGSSSRPNQVPGPEITHNFPLLAQPTPLLPQSNERSHLLHEEGRREPPNQPGAQGHAHRCTQLPFTRPPPVDVPRHQTQSVSQSLSRSASVTSSVTQSASSENFKRLEKRIEELESSSGEWRTHCHFLHGEVTRLRNQLQAKEKRRGTHAKRTQVEARVLTSEEGRLELQQLREEARLKEQRQAEDAARKATEDQARRNRRADNSRIFTGPLNKTRRKEDLEDIAVALALPDGGKKDELLERISNYFEEHPDQKTTPRFEGLFNARPRKRARLADTPQIPVAGPSTVEQAFPPSSSFPAPSSSFRVPITFGPVTPSHGIVDFLPTSTANSPYNGPYFTPQ